MGVMTGVAGGIIRDMLSGEIPLVLKAEIYATASLCGAIIFAVLTNYFHIHAAGRTSGGHRDSGPQTGRDSLESFTPAFPIGKKMKVHCIEIPCSLLRGVCQLRP